MLHYPAGRRGGEIVKITLKHGSGGEESGRLIKDIFTSVFDDEILLKMEDSAVLPPLHGNPVLTSDSFVVEPLFLKAGISGNFLSAVR